MIDPDAEIPRPQRSLIYLGAFVIAGSRLARERGRSMCGLYRQAWPSRSLLTWPIQFLVGFSGRCIRRQRSSRLSTWVCQDLLPNPPGPFSLASLCCLCVFGSGQRCAPLVTEQLVSGMRQLTFRGFENIPARNRLDHSCGSERPDNSFSQSFFVLTSSTHSCIFKMGRRYRLRFKAL